MPCDGVAFSLRNGSKTLHETLFFVSMDMLTLGGDATEVKSPCIDVQGLTFF